MKVIVIPYDPAWPSQFQREAAVLKSILKDELISLHHIGSTSVPGMSAKPVIDMLPVVRDIARIDDLHNAMLQIGYEGLGENGLPGRRFFRKGGSGRTHHVHVYQFDHEDVARHVAFRDYLCAHDEIAARYGELKARLALLHPDSIESYMDGKDAFIKEFEARALAWQRVKLR